MADQENKANETFYDLRSEMDGSSLMDQVHDISGNTSLMPTGNCQCKREQNQYYIKYILHNDKVDIEGLEEKASLQEDAIVSGFTKWLISGDESKKPSRQASKGKD